MKRILQLLTFVLCLLPLVVYGQQPISGRLNIREIDGSPSGYPWQLQVTNGTLTDNGDGTMILVVTGGSLPSPTRGDVLTAQGASPAWASLPKGTQYQLLNMGASEPTWTSILGATGTRLTYGYFTDLAVTNAITGSVTGAAGNVNGVVLAGIPAAGGTVHDITVTNSPALGSLVDKQIQMFRSAGANTAATPPTFAPDGLTARNIVKQGGQALVAGDIGAAGMIAILQYDLSNTRWELLNPIYPPGQAGCVGDVDCYLGITKNSGTPAPPTNTTTGYLAYKTDGTPWFGYNGTLRQAVEFAVTPGTCNGTTYIHGDGTCATPSGAAPGGSSGDIQTNNGSGGFGAITPGTGVATALAVNTGTTGAFSTISGTLTNGHGVKVSTDGKGIVDNAGVDAVYSEPASNLPLCRTGAGTTGACGNLTDVVAAPANMTDYTYFAIDAGMDSVLGAPDAAIKIQGPVGSDLSANLTPVNVSYAGTCTISAPNVTTCSWATSGTQTATFTMTSLTVGKLYRWQFTPTITSQVPTITATSGVGASSIPTLVTTVVENIYFRASATTAVFTITSTAASTWATASTSLYEYSRPAIGREFAAASQQTLAFDWMPPDDWDGGTIYFKTYGVISETAPADGNTAIFQMSGYAISDSQSLSQAVGTAQSSTFTAASHVLYDEAVFPYSAAITLANTPAAGKKIRLMLDGLGTGTYGQKIAITGFQIKFKRTLAP